MVVTGDGYPAPTFIYLLAIAKVAITSKRNGLWALKPRLLQSLEEPWRQVLSKTRQGFIGLPISNEQTS